MHIMLSTENLFIMLHRVGAYVSCCCGHAPCNTFPMRPLHRRCSCTKIRANLITHNTMGTGLSFDALLGGCKSSKLHSGI